MKETGGNFYDRWRVFRQHKIKYFVIRSTILFGIPLWIIILLLSWAFGISLYGDHAHWYLIIFCILGFGYTFLEWKYNEKKFIEREGE